MVDAVDDGMTDTTGRINPGNTIQQFIRTCRHMGIAESSPSCDICNLVSFSTLLLYILSK